MAYWQSMYESVVVKVWGNVVILQHDLSLNIVIFRVLLFKMLLLWFVWLFLGLEFILGFLGLFIFDFVHHGYEFFIFWFLILYLVGVAYFSLFGLFLLLFANPPKELFSRPALDR